MLYGCLAKTKKPEKCSNHKTYIAILESAFFFKNEIVNYANFINKIQSELIYFWSIIMISLLSIWIGKLKIIKIIFYWK